MCDSTKDEEEDEKNVDAFITHNQITDHSLDNRNDVGTPFSSNKIKIRNKIMEANLFFECFKTCWYFSEFITKFSLTSINGNKITYLKLFNPIIQNQILRKKSIMNEWITKVIFTNKCKVFRVLDNKLSGVMSEKEIRKIIWFSFRT